MSELMSGVELLSEKVSSPLCFPIVGAFLLPILVETVLFILSYHYDINLNDPLSVLIAATAIITGGVIGERIGVQIRPQTICEVTVSEEVSLVEFNERYSILEQDGKVYTIQIKE